MSSQELLRWERFSISLVLTQGLGSLVLGIQGSADVTFTPGVLCDGGLNSVSPSLSLSLSLCLLC